jgi:SAM-dependent methyltransferase
VTLCVVCNHSFAANEHVRWTKDGFDILQCPSCGLLFRRNLPTQEELDGIYGLAYFKSDAAGAGEGYLDYVADAELHRMAARRRLDAIERLVSHGTMLDVGAAAGFFVAEARARRWDARGIDVSAPMVEWGRRELHIPLDRATLESCDATAGGLDVVTMWDYIEHSIDPVADLKAAHRLLRPGGVLALSTGDAATLVARVSGSRWHLLTPHHHNYFFTAQTLSSLLSRLGFEIVSLDHRGNRYPLRYLVHKLRTIIPWRALDVMTRRLAHSRVGAMPVPMNLWDIVTVVARRT